MQRRRIAPITLALSVASAAVLGLSCRPPSSGAESGGCPPGARVSAAGCRCRDDLRPALGACVAPRTAAELCGPLAEATERGCAPRPPCEEGRARDLISGACLARRDVRALAAGLGIRVADDESLGCAEGLFLTAVAEGPGGGRPRLGCLPGATTPARVCPAGSLVTAVGACARVGDGASVDAGRWLQAVVGPEGGEGTPLLCEALARWPGAPDPALGEARISVTLAFPDNDVSQVVADARSGAVELGQMIGPMIEALRALGGSASQASVATSIRCRGRHGPGAGASANANVEVRGRAQPEAQPD